MTPDVVVDIGNSRIKWGWRNAAGTFQHLSMDPDNRDVWEAKVPDTGHRSPLLWGVASVHPKRLERFTAWATGRGDQVVTIHDRARLPIRIQSRDPDAVGIDRLLGAIAANARRRPDCPAVTVDVGTAVTINLVDTSGAFRGGAILPGFRLMAAALHQNTAKLPFVEPSQPSSHFPGQDTVDAIRLGIHCAIEGAVTTFRSQLTEWQGPTDQTDVFYTGGNATLLVPVGATNHVPTLNLEGIRLAAEALP